MRFYKKINVLQIKCLNLKKFDSQEICVWFRLYVYKSYTGNLHENPYVSRKLSCSSYGSKEAKEPCSSLKVGK